MMKIKQSKLVFYEREELIDKLSDEIERKNISLTKLKQSVQFLLKENRELKEKLNALRT